VLCCYAAPSLPEKQISGSNFRPVGSHQSPDRLVGVLAPRGRTRHMALIEWLSSVAMKHREHHPFRHSASLSRDPQEVDRWCDDTVIRLFRCTRPILAEHARRSHQQNHNLLS
ncbi:hypothetical protein ACVBEG_27845, partial [Pseudomonas sp. GG8]